MIAKILTTFTSLLFISAFGQSGLQPDTVGVAASGVPVAYYFSETACAVLYKNSGSLLFFVPDTTDAESEKIVRSGMVHLDYEFTGDSLALYQDVLALWKRKNRRSYRNSFYRPAIYDRDSSGYSVDYEPVYNGRMERTRGNVSDAYIQPRIARNYTIVAHRGNFLCLDESYKNILTISETGKVLYRSEITVKKPMVYSLKGKELYYDREEEMLYMVIKTNYGYNWYSILPETGEAELVYQFRKIWPDPNWEVNNGFLNYDTEENGVRVRHEDEVAL